MLSASKYKKNIVEHFNLPPFNSVEEANLIFNEENGGNDTIYKFLEENDASVKELYDTINDFDIPPKKLSERKKENRKKYLELLDKAVDEEILDDMLPSSNKDSIYKLLKRTISLFLLEMGEGEDPDKIFMYVSMALGGVVLFLLLVVILK